MRYRCPSCRELFKMPGGEWPTSCPSCGYDTSIPDREEIAIPAFLSPKAANEDKLYRQIEKGSGDRVQLAAQAAGCDASDMAGLKITDLNTGKGVVAAPTLPANAVTQRMAEMEARGFPTGFGAASQGVAASPAVQSGPYPNAGTTFQAAIQRVLPPMADSRPAIETQQPGYRRRA